MARAVKNYILLVDSGKPPARRHASAGRYRVGAKTKREAVRLLQEEIKFGSIQVYFECTDGKDIPYKAVKKEIP